jgi:uncharacterized repeat protein (TIGR01451 family)
LLSGNTISGYVFLDANNNGIYQAGDTPISGNPIELFNSAGTLVGRTNTNSSGYYSFSTDSTISTSPKTQSFNLDFPDNKTNQTQRKTIPQFDPSLGTLTAIDFIIQGQITSDIKVENEDPSPATITGVVSGNLNIAGRGFSTQVTTSSSSRTFDASAWDGVTDYAGTSGKDFGSVTVPGSKTITLTDPTALLDYSGTGAVTISENAVATSSADGGGNLQARITSSGSAHLTVVYHYRPQNALGPGTYTIVQAEEPPGTINGKFSRNGTVFNPTPGRQDSITVTINGNDAPNNDFGELLPSADLSVVKSANPNPVLVNGTLTYTLMVANAGPTTATSVTVTDTLPPGVTFVSASGSGWSITHGGSVVTCTRPSMASGASSVITITVKAPSHPGSITNTAVVSSHTPDHNPNNNRSTVTTQVVNTPTVVSSQVFPPLPSSFPNVHNMSFLSKLDFLAVGGPNNIDPTVLADATYVDGVYRTLLNHDADMASLVNWVKYLRNGGSRAVVVNAIWVSDEHRDIEVTNYFLAFLHRPADAASQAAWAGLFRAGYSEMDVVRLILDSGEYQANHPTNDIFIAGLYADLLGRTPDPADVTALEQVLQSGTSRDAVIQGFLHSDEESLSVIDSTYVSVFHRSADPAGQQAWLNAFRSGAASGATITQQFLASDEFFAMAVAASQA